MRLAVVEWNRQNISGITGFMSISCWVVVFLPQIYENFIRKSSEGLSLLFIVLWLIGDIFNWLGAIKQRLLSTMIILAAYYTIADIILWFQCIWYQERDSLFKTLAVKNSNGNTEEGSNYENEPLLNSLHSIERALTIPDLEHGSQDFTYDNNKKLRNNGNLTIHNFLIVNSVIFSGFLSWYIQYCSTLPPRRDTASSVSPKASTTVPRLEMDLMAQIFGYLSAVLYLGSRVPQILLNFKRKSCDGVSFLFFLFACLGNTLFIISVLVVSLDPRYLLVNASWLIGSSGTLLLDLTIFIQFFIFGDGQENSKRTTAEEEEEYEDATNFTSMNTQKITNLIHDEEN
ncbi:cationic amino acid transporter NDAI_0A07020 [Naumovozyma dairenensis CBS 421]|uniref:PQ-loop repeat-containing protein n=1 Tax=Naumovozyma dairenensis (strain ATCC 10597 / BCRC 20456 / CBS 421 / NBRC 0211 / NRRL Y-12639) TaxID=1071378 RepID=G0W4W8_NAUDC|nr:hypothetical protein NDAI_0A07020 [Naumovozyma dairenensis CBS 421]CCD22856.1 hypothetical protein NDAI_0A07020 [Naumovozyma dairenensis CBS 421]